MAFVTKHGNTKMRVWGDAQRNGFMETQDIEIGVWGAVAALSATSFVASGDGQSLFFWGANTSILNPADSGVVAGDYRIWASSGTNSAEWQFSGTSTIPLYKHAALIEWSANNGADTASTQNIMLPMPVYIPTGYSIFHDVAVPAGANDGILRGVFYYTRKSYRSGD